MEAIEVRVTYQGDAETTTFEARELPIRFGRDPNCELLLMYPFVSRIHGRIEVNGQGLVVVADEGSTNGLRHKGSRVATNSVVVLDADGGDFEIDGLTISIRIVDAVTELMVEFPSERTSPDDTTIPIPTLEARTTSLYAEQQIRPGSLDDGLRILDEYRAGRARALTALRALAAGGSRVERVSLVRELASAFGELGHDPELQELAGAEPHAARSLEASPVVRAVERLAASQVPGAAAPSVDELLAFLERIDRVLGATFDRLIELELCSRFGRPQNALAPVAAGAESRAHLLAWQGGVGDIDAWLRDVFATIRERYEARLAEEPGLRVLAATALPKSAPASPSWWRRLFRFRHAVVQAPALG